MDERTLQDNLTNEAEWLHRHLQAGDWIAAQAKVQNLLCFLQELTGKERVRYLGMGKYATEESVDDWQSRAMQLQSETDQLREKLDEAERKLTKAILRDFRTPKAPEEPANEEEPEPFSQ